VNLFHFQSHYEEELKRLRRLLVQAFRFLPMGNAYDIYLRNSSK
jgi:hypothetical protein